LKALRRKTVISDAESTPEDASGGRHDCEPDVLVQQPGPVGPSPTYRALPLRGAPSSPTTVAKNAEAAVVANLCAAPTGTMRAMGKTAANLRLIRLCVPGPRHLGPLLSRTDRNVPPGCAFRSPHRGIVRNRRPCGMSRSNRAVNGFRTATVVRCRGRQDDDFAGTQAVAGGPLLQSPSLAQSLCRAVRRCPHRD